jgi:hypothetical protein
MASGFAAVCQPGINSFLFLLDLLYSGLQGEALEIFIGNLIAVFADNCNILPNSGNF